MNKKYKKLLKTVGVLDIEHRNTLLQRIRTNLAAKNDRGARKKIAKYPIMNVKELYEYLDARYGSENWCVTGDHIMVHYPEIMVKDSNGREYKLENCYIKLRFSYLSDPVFYKATWTWGQINNQYMHSHISYSGESPTNGYIKSTNFCWGNAATKIIQDSTYERKLFPSSMIFNMLCLLDKFLTEESSTTIPFSRICNNLAQRTKEYVFPRKAEFDLDEEIGVNISYMTSIDPLSFEVKTESVNAIAEKIGSDNTDYMCFIGPGGKYYAYNSDTETKEVKEIPTLYYFGKKNIICRIKEEGNKGQLVPHPEIKRFITEKINNDARKDIKRIAEIYKELYVQDREKSNGSAKVLLSTD